MASPRFQTKLLYWAVLPAAGAGARLGARLPKQYLQLHGRSLLEWSLAPLLASRWIAGVVVVLAPGDRRFAKLEVAAHPRIVTTTGADTRAGSVLAGLQAVPDSRPRATYVLVHDAARPCVQPADLRRLRDMASDRHGGLLATPAVDTLKQSRRGRSVVTLDRSAVWQAQTPQMFRLDLLRHALRDCITKRTPVTDEASAMEAAGFRPRLVAASSSNLKVTYPEDLRVAEFWLAQRTGKL